MIYTHKHNYMHYKQHFIVIETEYLVDAELWVAWLLSDVTVTI